MKNFDPRSFGASFLPHNFCGKMRSWSLSFMALLLFIGGNIAAQTTIYSTTQVGTSGGEITPIANGPACSLGDVIVLGGSDRYVTQIQVELFTLTSLDPYTITASIYTDCSTNGTGNTPCGNGLGVLVPGSVQTATVTPTTLGAIVVVTINYPTPVDLTTEVDNTISVVLNASRNDVFWILGETPIVGSTPPGEPATSFVTRCGSVAANNGCQRNFGVTNNFSMLITAITAPPSGVGCSGTYTINIGACANFLDEVSFQIRNASNVTVFTVNPVNVAGTFTYVASGTGNDIGPFTFFIETQGSFNDNCATYSVSCEYGPLLSGTLGPNLTFTSASFCCTPPTGCTTASFGQFPAAAYTPLCTGSPEVIVANGWAGEYSVVNVTSGQAYTFSSSVATDFITLTDATGTTIYNSGTGSVSWTATFTGTIRFYTHLSIACDEASTNRERRVTCALFNDTCATAFPLTCGQTVTGSTVGASSVGNGPDCTTTASTAGSLWYTFTANNQNVQLTSCGGTSYDNKIFVYTGSCGAFTCVVGNDDFCGLQSEVSFAAVNGVTYYILVAGFGTATGSFTLTANCTDLPPPAVNDECLSATSLSVPSCGTYSTVGSTDSPDSGPQCFDNEFGNPYYFGGDVWFSFVMPPSGWVTLTADNITFFAFIGGTPIAPLGIEIYSGDCAGFGGGTGPFCNQAQATAGFPSDPACQSAVCALDPFCCNFTWDGICAGEAAVEPACAGCLTGAGGTNVAEQCEILWDNQADEMLFQGTPGQTYLVRVWDLFEPLEQEAFDLCIEETQATIQGCNETFTDSGGAAGNYADVERKWYIICGTTPADIVEVTFNTFSIEANFDFMTVWDSFGPSATPLAGPVTGTAWQGTTFTSSNPSGCLTFFFESDNIIQDLGWEADVRCLCPQVISDPAAYTDFLCDGETPDFASAEASIGYQDNSGNPADGSVFTIKWFLNPTYTQPAPPNYVATYTGTGCAPQSTFLYARGTCSTGEFFDAGFMVLVVYPTPEAPQIILTSSGTICTYAYAPATCPATSFSPANPTNETLGTPSSTVTVTSTNGGCTVSYDIEKPACDACYIPSNITGSACAGIVPDFADFEGSLDTGGSPGLGDVLWYYDDSFTQLVDENAPLNFTASGCTPSTYTLYALGTCATGALEPAGTLTLTFYAAPAPPTISVNDFTCTYSYSAPECPYISYVTPLTNEVPGAGGATVSVDVALNDCIYTYEVFKPLCVGCDLATTFTLVYEAGTSTSSFFNFGYITLTGSFVTPLAYEWEVSGYVTYGVPTPGTINILYTDDAVFTVTITDAVGCSATYTNLPSGINDLSIISSLITADNGTSSGAVNITVAGGTSPYTYSWEGPLGYTAATEDVSGLPTGWYIVYITSTDGQSAYGWFWVPKQSRGRGKTEDMASITAFPNPFVGQTNIAFSVAESTDATVTLHGINGQQTRQLFSGNVNGGETINLSLDANDLPAGIYIARLTTANGEVQNYKLILGQ